MCTARSSREDRQGQGRLWGWFAWGNVSIFFLIIDTWKDFIWWAPLLNVWNITVTVSSGHVHKSLKEIQLKYSWRIFFPKLCHLKSRHLLGQGNDGEHAGDVHPDGLGQVLVEADCGSAVEHNMDLGDENRDDNWDAKSNERDEHILALLPRTLC